MRFGLSLRDVEDLLAARGITVSYETIRDWVERFCIQFSANIRRDRPRPADKWHLDEVVVPIKGRKNWLWRAVDANGDVLDILVQSRRNKAAAMRFLSEGGVPVAELCREHGMSNASFYKWRAKYGGMDASMVSQMKAMEEENRRLKRMYADLDNGPEYISEKLMKWAEKHGVTIQHIQPGQPQQNAYIERYNRTVRHEWLDKYIIESIEEAQDHATQWLWTYNNDRPNMGIGGITPAMKLKMAA